MEVELDPENREGLEKDEQEEEEKEVKSDVDVNSKDTNEIANTSIAASRTRRSTAGLKLSKIGEKKARGNCNICFNFLSIAVVLSYLDKNFY